MFKMGVINIKMELKHTCTGYVRARENVPRSTESEKTLEKRLVREIEKRGGLALKQTSQYHRGIPDRLILLPGGRVLWAEIKATGKKPTRLQQLAMEHLVGMGFWCFVVDSTSSLNSLLNEIDSL